MLNLFAEDLSIEIKMMFIVRFDLIEIIYMDRQIRSNELNITFVLQICHCIVSH